MNPIVIGAVVVVVVVVLLATGAIGAGKWILNAGPELVADKMVDDAKDALRAKIEELEGENEALSRSLAAVETRYEELETRYDELEISAEDLEAKAEAAEQNLAIERSSWSRLYAE